MQIIKTVEELRPIIQEWRSQGLSVGLVAKKNARKMLRPQAFKKTGRIISTPFFATNSV